MAEYGTFNYVVPYWNTSFSGDCPSQAAFPGNPPTTLYMNLTRTRYGSSLRNYKALLAAGSDATTNFAATRQTFNHKPHVAWHEYRTLKNGGCIYHRKRKAWWSGPLGPTTTTPTVAMNNAADNQARTAFYKKYESILTSFNGGVLLGELRETLHMIRNPAKAIRSALDAHVSELVKRKGLSTKRRLDHAGKAWLEYSFGIAPLVNDLDDAMGYLAKRRDQLSRDFISIGGHGESATNTTSVAESSALAHSFYIKYERRNKLVSTVRYRGAVRADVTGRGELNMSALGLAPRSFVPTLWELVPWSFAVDYFTNLGDVITSYSNGVAKLAWGCKTSRGYSDSECIGLGVRWSSGAAQTIEKGYIPGYARSVYTTVNRDKVTYVPIPDLAFELPGLGTKWINLAALAASRRTLGQR